MQIILRRWKLTILRNCLLVGMQLIDSVTIYRGKACSRACLEDEPTERGGEMRVIEVTDMWATSSENIHLGFIMF